MIGRASSWFRRSRLTAGVVLVWLGSSSCLTWRMAGEAPEVVLERDRPSSVRLTLADGNVLVLSDPAVADRAVVSDDGGSTAALADIRTLEVRRFHIARTVGLGALIVGFALTWLEAFGGNQGGNILDSPGPEPK